MFVACGEGIILHYCDVVSTTGDFGMAIIMPDRLYSVLSCQLAPTGALSMRHEKRVSNGATCALAGPHLSSGVGSEATWTNITLV
jgi:hypothetical protein